jgi:hypothetical protein
MLIFIVLHYYLFSKFYKVMLRYQDYVITFIILFAFYEIVSAIIGPILTTSWFIIGNLGLSLTGFLIPLLTILALLRSFYRIYKNLDLNMQSFTKKVFAASLIYGSVVGIALVFGTYHFAYSWFYEIIHHYSDFAMFISAPVIALLVVLPRAWPIGHVNKSNLLWNYFILLVITFILTTLIILIEYVITMIFHISVKYVIGAYGFLDDMLWIPVLYIITIELISHKDILKHHGMIMIYTALFTVIFTYYLILPKVPQIAGPIFGAAISVFAIGLSEVGRYLSSTAPLDYELHARKISNDDIIIYAVIKNRNGNALVKNARANVMVYKVNKVCDVTKIEWVKALPWAMPNELRGTVRICADVASIDLENEVLIARIRKRAREEDIFHPYVFTIHPYVNCKTIISPPFYDISAYIYEYFYEENPTLELPPSTLGYSGLIFKERECVRYEINITGEGARGSLRFNVYLTNDNLGTIFKWLERESDVRIDDLVTVTPVYQVRGKRKCTC